jgi:hypothetical protein
VISEPTAQIAFRPSKDTAFSCVMSGPVLTDQPRPFHVPYSARRHRGNRRVGHELPVGWEPSDDSKVRSPARASFADWASDTGEGFVLAVISGGWGEEATGCRVKTLPCCSSREGALMYGPDLRTRRCGQRAAVAQQHHAGPASVAARGRQAIADLAAIEFTGCRNPDIFRACTNAGPPPRVTCY